MLVAFMIVSNVIATTNMILLALRNARRSQRLRAQRDQHADVSAVRWGVCLL
jgi:hypothetical protein